MLPDDETKIFQFFEAVRDVCGEDGVWAIQESVGGRDIYVPQVVRASNLIAKAVGLDDAQKISTALIVHGADDRPISFGLVKIPLGAKSLILQRRAQAERRLIEGASARSVAAELGVAGRTVFRLRARLVNEGKITRREISQVAKKADHLLLLGYSSAEIGRTTGAPISSVTQRRIALSIRNKLEFIDTIRKARPKIDKMLLSGLAVDVVADMLGRHVTSVLYCRRRLVAAGKLVERS